MKVTNCKINHLTNPIGFQMDDLVFSWIVESTDGLNPFELTSRIRVYTDNETTYTSEWDQWNPLATELPVPLSPRTRYYWELSILTPKHDTEVFHCGWFETGKMDEPWVGKWISCDSFVPRHPIFFKDFSIDAAKTIHSARLYISGLGLYETYINGQKIGTEFLAPGCTVYDEWVQAQVYDITGQLLADNTISILLGNGWYKGRFSFNPDKNRCYPGRWETIAELHIVYTDGSIQVLSTDDSWHVKRSNIIASGIYDGEKIDDTLPELPVENVTISNGPEAKLCDRLSLPVEEHEHFTPRLLHSPAGEQILDLGQNHAGLFYLKINEPGGRRIRLQFGETLQNGNFYRDNLRTAKAEFVYISDGEPHVLRPHFTFYGYRYVKLEGISNFTEADYDGFAIYSSFMETGSLVTGHSKINQLISNTKWGMKSNFIDVPTDCPQRDERLGWTGDAQVFCRTAFYLADAYAFYRKYLHDMALEQRKRNGMVPDYVPAYSNNTTSSGWGDATCIIPWNMYLFTGDSSILKSHYAAMKSWVEYIEHIDGNNHGWRDVFHYGDWLALDTPYSGEDNVRGGTDEGFIADVFYRKCLIILSKAAKILGKAEEAKTYGQKAQKVLNEMTEEFYSPTGRCCINTQTANALTICEALNKTDRAKAALIELLKNRRNMLSTGFIGTPILCEALSSVGLEEQAFRLLLNEEYPGWLYSVNQGATTIWERWNSIDETGHITSTGMNSLNHYSYGAIIAWIYNSCAGISPLEESAGFRKVRLEPLVNYKLRYLDATYPSPAGTYKIFWEIIGTDTIHIKFEIPAGCEAIVTLPYADAQETGWSEAQFTASGSYEFTYKANRPLVKIYTVDSALEEMLQAPDVRNVLYRELENPDKYFPFGRNFPLSETMNNHGDGSPELFNRLNGELRKAALR